MLLQLCSEWSVLVILLLRHVIMSSFLRASGTCQFNIEEFFVNLDIGSNRNLGLFLFSISLDRHTDLAVTSVDALVPGRYEDFLFG